MSLKIMQGDQYAIVFTGTQDGAPLDLSKIEMIEFIVGKRAKSIPARSRRTQTETSCSL